MKSGDIYKRKYGVALRIPIRIRCSKTVDNILIAENRVIISSNLRIHTIVELYQKVGESELISILYGELDTPS